MIREALWHDDFLRSSYRKTHIELKMLKELVDVKDGSRDLGQIVYLCRCMLRVRLYRIPPEIILNLSWLCSTYLLSRLPFSFLYLFGSVRFPERTRARARDLRDDLNIYNARSLTLPLRARIWIINAATMLPHARARRCAFPIPYTLS